MTKEKVIIGMSGGVDSSVAAALLLEQGYDVIGVTMKIWPESLGQDKIREGGCCSLSAVDDARRVANQLGIPYYVMNFQEIFEKTVIDYFVDEYQKGRTPNPCIACNKFVKFDALLKKAVAMGVEYVATGHYARVVYDGELSRYLLKKSVTAAKDQTYALYNLTQDQLKHILMPLGNYTKEQTREIARKLGLTVAAKPDSQEICFVEDNNYARFIEERTGNAGRKGFFVDTEGNILGEHKGIIHYTVGQRKGLGIAFGKPMYVIAIDAKDNKVVLGESGQEYSDALVAIQPNFIPFDRLEKDLEVTAKIRYSAKEAEATISPYQDDKVLVKFKTPQRAVTPGQAVVFYDGDVLVGGGTIDKAVEK
ncbi:MAG: tRNA-uridine 2-sulfurtransferase [Petroclostridium sp.]|jgi:tRNA-specific 2-thiouridylase|uniref:tRNA 2-thiouridine(34) synthase MnmA n=1 Tax=Petroclostridium xylanilyticum TaxID=1792311 RepID=UPI000B98C14D|nr:tRNA 2-thiouridine(34) synthase MnmA [Petroclostridium xylanilyticum]MBZ4644767.1 tRNA (5-methylaminomethyl-2-thiouridylate)-methyltransferase [Clostridia bacterium]MDK2810842.1 tRNA-uridine 2-sulfurtransferase [Petroclostridium sp.]